MSTQIQGTDKRGRHLLLASACVGGTLGLVFANWQWAVELGQAQVGLVAYGRDSVPGITAAALWSFPNQIAGALLVFGLTERTVSAIVSAVVGILWFQSITMFIFAVCRRPLAAVCGTVICFVSATTPYGNVYPGLGVATPHTGGAFALTIPLLAIGLLGSEWRRSGAFLLGLAPAFHVATGGVAILCVAVAAYAAGRTSRPFYASAAGWFAGGLGASGLSFAWQLIHSPHRDAMDPAVVAQYFNAFVSFWDGHRAGFDWRALSTWLIVESIGIALCALWAWRRQPVPASRFVLAFGVAWAAASVVLAGISSLPLDHVPRVIQVGMPGRFVNLSAMTFAPLLFGLAATTTSRSGRCAVLLVLSAGLLLVPGSEVVEFLHRFAAFTSVDGLYPKWFFSIAGAVIAVLVLAGFAVPWPSGGATESAVPGRAGWIFSARVSVPLVTCGCLVIWWLGPAMAPYQPESLWDHSDDTVWSAARADHGVLLTGGGLWLIQLRTRRPVLLEGGTLDTLPYAVDSGPAMNDVLRRVYGIDLFHPPAEARRHGAVPNVENLRTWHEFSREKWRRVAGDFGVTQVLTQAHWELNLPIVAVGRNLKLYSIPSSGPVASVR